MKTLKILASLAVLLALAGPAAAQITVTDTVYIPVVDGRVDNVQLANITGIPLVGDTIQVPAQAYDASGEPVDSVVYSWRTWTVDTVPEPDTLVAPAAVLVDPDNGILTFVRRTGPTERVALEVTATQVHSVIVGSYRVQDGPGSISFVGTSIAVGELAQHCAYALYDGQVVAMSGGSPLFPCPMFGSVGADHQAMAPYARPRAFRGETLVRLAEYLDRKAGRAPVLLRDRGASWI